LASALPIGTSTTVKRLACAAYHKHKKEFSTRNTLSKHRSCRRAGITKKAAGCNPCAGIDGDLERSRVLAIAACFAAAWVRGNC